LCIATPRPQAAARARSGTRSSGNSAAGPPTKRDLLKRDLIYSQKRPGTRSSGNSAEGPPSRLRGIGREHWGPRAASSASPSPRNRPINEQKRPTNTVYTGRVLRLRQRARHLPQDAHTCRQERHTRILLLIHVSSSSYMYPPPHMTPAARRAPPARFDARQKRSTIEEKSPAQEKSPAA
jgi:hypothetical protein